MRLAQVQQRKIEDLLTKLFDESLGSLTLAKMEIQHLRQEHKWHLWNDHRLDGLKEKLRSIQLLSYEGINQILQDIREEKERSRQLLYNELNRLNDITDRDLAGQYLNRLMSRLDQLITTTNRLLSGEHIFGFLAVAAVTIIAAVSGSFVLSKSNGFFLGITSLAIAAVCATIDENSFQTKLSEIDGQLVRHMRYVQQQKTAQTQQMSSCFNAFIQNLRPHKLD